MAALHVEYENEWKVYGKATVHRRSRQGRYPILHLTKVTVNLVKSLGRGE